jgi:hypothetical protein
VHVFTTGSGGASRALSPPVTILVAVVFGLIIGGATALLQGELPGSWNPLANSGAVWLLCAALCSVVAPRTSWAAAAGTVSLLAMLAGFYVTAIVVHGTPESRAIAAVWTVAALLGGPVYGAAGFWLRGASDRARAAGIALIAGALIGEGIALLVVIQNFAAFAVGEFAVAVAVLVLAPSRLAWRAQAALGTALIAVIVFAARAAIDTAISHV